MLGPKELEWGALRYGTSQFLEVIREPNTNFQAYTVELHRSSALQDLGCVRS